MTTEDMMSQIMTGFTAAYYVGLAIFYVLLVIAFWKMFEKAGEEGWKSIIPLYNTYILYKLTWGNGWFFLLNFIPCVNVVVSIITCFKTAKAYGKGIGFGFGLLFLYNIFLLILGFGSAEYVGPDQTK